MKTRSEITIEVCGISRTLALELTRNGEGELSARVAWVDDPDNPSPYVVTPWLEADDWLWDLLSGKQAAALEREFIGQEARK